MFGKDSTFLQCQLDLQRYHIHDGVTYLTDCMHAAGYQLVGFNPASADSYWSSAEIWWHANIGTWPNIIDGLAALSLLAAGVAVPIAAIMLLPRLAGPWLEKLMAWIGGADNPPRP